MRATLSLPLLGAALLTLSALALRLSRSDRRLEALSSAAPLSGASRPLPDRLRELGL